MEVIDIEDLRVRRPRAYEFLVTAVTVLDDVRGTSGAFFKERGERGPNFQIEFKIDGVEIPFVETITRIAEKFSDVLAEQAAEIIETRFGEEYRRVVNLLDDVKKHVVRRAEEAVGFTRRDEDT
jgi:hypothetical protein